MPPPALPQVAHEEEERRRKAEEEARLAEAVEVAAALAEAGEHVRLRQTRDRCVLDCPCV
jgi:hypothetical protein